MSLTLQERVCEIWESPLLAEILVGKISEFIQIYVQTVVISSILSNISPILREMILFVTQSFQTGGEKTPTSVCIIVYIYGDIYAIFIFVNIYICVCTDTEII